MILVLGANGFLGMHVLQHLLQQQSNVGIRASYRRASSPLLQHPRLTWVPCDILDIDALLQAMQGCKQVYHCANTVSFDANAAATMHYNNVEGSANVVNIALHTGVQKLLFVSSVAAIARQQDGKLINEATPWLIDDTTSAYALSKYKAEMEVWRGAAEGLNVVIVNPSVILGEGNWHNSSCALFKTLYDGFAWYTAGTNGFVDVKDVAKAMYLLMESDVSNERFIINQNNYSYKKLFALISTSYSIKAGYKLASFWMSTLVWRMYAVRKFFTGKRALITKETAATANSIYRYDNTKLLKVVPSFTYSDMPESIERICSYYKQNNEEASS